jgi:hydroxyacylglutathione hydrolase
MKLTDTIHLLKLDFEIAISPEKKLPRFVNSIIIFGEKITIIDTGVLGSEKHIFDYIIQNNREIKDIDKIILSHSHPDHIGSAAAIKESTRCRIYAHELEKEWIEKIEVQNKQRPVPGFYNLVNRSVTIDEFLLHSQKLKLDHNITAEIIHSPGHSKGSINILFKEDNILFSADSIPLKGDIPNYDNFAELIQSLERIKKNKEYSILLSSWAPPVLNLLDAYNLIREGEEYMFYIDSVVKQNYNGNEPEPMAFCKATINQIGLPPFLANHIVDKAFRSHLEN